MYNDDNIGIYVPTLENSFAGSRAFVSVDKILLLLHLLFKFVNHLVALKFFFPLNTKKTNPLKLALTK